MRLLQLSLLTGTLSVFSLFMARPLQAEITGHIDVNIPHSFTVSETTLPPGKYVFQMVPNSDLSVMRVTSEAGHTSAEFLVREARVQNTPPHTQLVFDRYGNREFLMDVFETGHNYGVAVDEPSREQIRLEKQGNHAVEHTEEQQ